jgi:hypothetical protein
VDDDASAENFGSRHNEMLKLLQLFREKSLQYDDKGLETFRLQLFRRHCINIASVINPTAAENQFLFGDSMCQPCDSSLSPSSSTSCTSGQRNNPPQSTTTNQEHNIFKFDWNIDVGNNNFLPKSRSTLNLCRESFCFMYGISVNSMKRISSSMKTAGSSEITTAKKERDYNHHTYFGDQYTMQEIMDIFDDNDLNGGADEARASLLRSCNSHIDAMLWMKDYFDRFEHQPNSKQIHLDTSFKRAIWEEYCKAPHEFLGTDQSVLSEGSFKFLWDQMYDNVKIRREKRVTGKCWTCAYINELRLKKKGREVALACKQLMIMHRGGFFMLERIEYRARVREAVINSPTTTMSTIIDGASQNHCTLPHAGPNAQFSSGLEQHIEGALTHGRGLTIYRSFPTVKADSDFTIYCLLEELRKWTAANDGVYPETWYIQIDGGSENANKYLFAAMEFLCIKRLCKRIILTR